MIRTLITGGTGLLGSAIAKKLVLGSETVRIMSRNPEEIPRSKRQPGSEFVKGDIFDETSLEAAMQGCDALINAVQFENAPFENPSQGLTYERVDGEGTERQIAAAIKTGVKRVIYISGAGTREGQTRPWFKAKLRAEKAVKESGLNWTIFRPSWVYGPGDRSLNKFATFARFLPFVPLIGTGKEKIQPVFVEDIGTLAWNALNREDTYGKVYEVGGPETLSMCEIAQTMLRVMKKRRLVLPHPKPVMKAIASIVQFLPGPFRFLTPDGVDFVTMEEAVDTSALNADFDIKLTRLEDALQTYLSGASFYRLPNLESRTT